MARGQPILHAPDPDAPVVLAPAAPGPVEYRVGCASWLDRALIASGRFYPRLRMSSEARLRWYARFFDTVEVNATYYGLPSPRTAGLWVDRTPPGFLFHVKAYSLMTGHHPRVETLPADVRLMLPDAVPLTRRGEVEAGRFPAEALDRCFELFRAGLDPLAEHGKLGYVLFQLAPWVRYDEAALQYLASLRRRLPGWTVAVEFRNASWIPERTDEVLRFLADHALSFVSLDAPWQPYVPAATLPGWAVLRLHGQNVKGWLDQLAGREPSVAEKYDYLYDPDELQGVARRVRAFEGHARRVAVTFNNNNLDYPVRNALDLKRLLGLPGAELPPAHGGGRAGALADEPDADDEDEHERSG